MLLVTYKYMTVCLLCHRAPSHLMRLQLLAVMCISLMRWGIL